MLDFKPIHIREQNKINHYLKQTGSYICDHSFVDIFLWKDIYNTEFSIKDDFLFMKVKPLPHNLHMYIFPIGIGNLRAAIEELYKDAKGREIPFIMTAIREEEKEKLEKIYPNKFSFTILRDKADYVYESFDLINLRGNKFHNKKNHINYFTRVYENSWNYEEICAENIKEVKQFCQNWFNYHKDDNGYFEEEKKALKNAFDYFSPLNLRGGLLRLDDKIVAFSLGSLSKKDMFIVHFEKADSNIKGSYQIINQQFSKHHCQHVKWINREEDLGIEGLRKAKLSYHPAFLVYKYMAVLNEVDSL